MENMVFKENNAYYTWKKLLIKDEVTGEPVEPLVKVKVDLPLYELCSELRNFFIAKIHKYEFKISGGKITPLNFLQKYQYFRIVGSIFNDGVYQYTEDLNLVDETFKGEVWAMALPPAFIALAAKDKEIKAKIDEIVKADTGFSSESYPNGYSYSNPSSLPAYMQEEIAEIQRQKNTYRRLSVL